MHRNTKLGYDSKIGFSTKYGLCPLVPALWVTNSIVVEYPNANIILDELHYQEIWGYTDLPDIPTLHHDNSASPFYLVFFWGGKKGQGGGCCGFVWFGYFFPQLFEASLEKHWFQEG